MLVLKNSTSKNSRNPSNFDPRPLKYGQPNSNALEKLRTDLLSLGQLCALLSILVPNFDIALHDHNYSKPPVPERESCKEASSYVYVREACSYNSEQLKLFCRQIKESLFCSDEQRIEIEQKT